MIMRLSTSQMYASTTAAITAKQSDLANIQNQLSTGKRISHLADDPAGAAQASALRSTLSANGQFDQNRQFATQRLSFAENILGAVGDNLQTVRETMVNAGNSTLSDTDRKDLAAKLRNSLGSLLSLGNTSDGEGGYLFGGYRNSAAPFSSNGLGVSYNADDGTRSVNVTQTRQMPVDFNGADVFMRIPNGNGVFATAANAANSGTGVIDSGSVSNPALLTGNNYQIRFQTSAAGTTYDVLDVTAGTTVSSGNPYTAPASISLPGISVGINGAPANGDTFSVAPSGNQSLFSIVSSAITALETPSNGNTAAVSNAVRASLSDLDQAITHVSSHRATAGARMNELDQLGQVGTARDVDLKGSLSSIEDVDYAKTISEFSVMQNGLQAALSTYQKIAGQSLFDYLR